MSNKNKVVYFLIGVDIDKGIKFIDDEAYTNMLQLLDKNDDPKETQEDYDKALVILNNPEWEKE